MSRLLPLHQSAPFLPHAVRLALLLLGATNFACTQQQADQASLPPADTSISVYGHYRPVKLPISKGVKIANPIQLALGPGGFLYAANQTGEIYSLRDTDGDGLEDTALLYTNIKNLGLRSPAGFAHRGDTVYIGTAQQIRAFWDRDRDGSADSSWVFFDQIPHSEHPYEWTSGLSFGPDGWLYAALTSDSWNAAPSPDPDKFRGAIIRISPDGKRAEPVATGIRSVHGMSFAPSGDLFFTDNEGGGNAAEELNRLVRNAFYGHNPAKYVHDSTTGPELVLQTELAPAGIEFNRPENDFGGTGGNLFIAFYGPGERWTRGGVGRVVLHRQANGRYTYQEQAIADVPKLSDLAFGPDGSLYLAQHGRADYWYNAIYDNEGAFYKLIYDPSVQPKTLTARAGLSRDFSKDAVEAGKQLFAERACLGCHAVDGTTELLGPNLKEVANRLSREEILEEIRKPSERIKPSMMAMRVIKKNGLVLMGRVVHADAQQITLMLIGNSQVTVKRSDILRTEDVPKSLMYEGLLKGMTDEQTDALLSYLSSIATPAP